MSEEYIKEYLRTSLGKIITINGIGNEKWVKEREKYLYTGKAKKLREVLKEELVIEFDHIFIKPKPDSKPVKSKPGSIEFNDARNEAIGWINAVKLQFDEGEICYHTCDHKGRSPHFRTKILGLEEYPTEVRSQYKLRLAKEILKAINFKSKKVELDESLICSFPKLVSMELQNHFKPEWKDNLEEITRVGPGHYMEVKSSIIKEIESCMWGEIKSSEHVSTETKHLIDAIKEKIKVSDILKEQGISITRNITNCPFHSSSSGTCLSYNDNKGIWNCFHCNKGGDIIVLWSLIHKTNFMETLKQLALKTGLKSQFEKVKKSRPASIQEAMNWYRGVMIGKKVVKDHKKANDLVARYLVETYPMMYDPLNDIIKMYGKEKYYAPMGEYLIKSTIEELLHKYATNGSRSEIINKIKNISKITLSKEEKPLNFIPFKNGVLDIQTLELKEHSPNDYFEYQIPHNYNPELKVGKVDKFIREVVNPEKVSLVYDCLGLIFYYGNLLEKIFMFSGAGQNGKTILIELLERAVGKSNTSSVPLHRLNSDKFALSATYQKLMNSGADIGGKVITDSSMLRGLSSKESIDAQFKFRDSFSMKPTATLVFSANVPPIFAENINANYRRLTTIKFPNSFGNEKDLELHPDWKKADPLILDKLTTEDEMEIFVSMGVLALKRIMETSALSVVESTDKAKNDYVMISDSLSAFIDRNCKEVEFIQGEYKRISNESIPAVGYITKEDFYNKYRDWCKRNGTTEFTKVKVGRVIKYHEFGISTSARVKIEGQQFEVYGGLEWF